MDGNRYMVERKVGATRWAEVKAKLFGLPIEIIDADQELAEAAGEIAVRGSIGMKLAKILALNIS